MSNKTGVFIIESNDFNDENDNRYEGRILTEILRMLGINTIYKYIRTKKEFKEVMEMFRKSEYRYLHLACHGDEDGIGLTLENVDFNQFNKILGKPFKKKRRLFLSSCEVLKNTKIEDGLKGLNFISIIGPTEEIDFADSAAFWAAFYHLMFKSNIKRMDNEEIRECVKNISILFNVNFNSLFKSSNGDNFTRYDSKGKKVVFK